jgi:hypothetical protein
MTALIVILLIGFAITACMNSYSRFKDEERKRDAEYRFHYGEDRP